MGAPSLLLDLLLCGEFKLKPNLIQMIEKNQLWEHSSESPLYHIDDFLEQCDTTDAKDLSKNAVHLFSFNLKDKAKACFKL